MRIANSKCLVGGAAFCCLFYSALAKATDTALSIDEAKIATPELGQDILSVTTGLVMVVAAILIVGFLYSRVSRLGGVGNNVIDIVASRSIGPKERLLLIEIANKQLLVGITSSNVQTLHLFEQPVVTRSEASQSSGFGQRFREILREAKK